MPGILEILKYWFALAAAVATLPLLVFLLLRSPRNIFTRLLTGMLACIVHWNLFEFARLYVPEDPATGAGWPLIVAFFGIVVLITLVFLYALQFVQSGAGRIAAGTVGCAVAAQWIVFLVLALLRRDFARVFWDSETSNALFIGTMGPFAAAAVALQVRGFLNAGPPMRGVYGHVLVAMATLAAFGIADLCVPLGGGLRIANIGALIAALVIAMAVVRYREVFDVLARLRREMGAALRASRHALLTFDRNGRLTHAGEAAGELLGNLPATLKDLRVPEGSALSRGGTTYVAAANGMIKATFVRGESGPGRDALTYVMLEDATREYTLFQELAHRESLASLGAAALQWVHQIGNATTPLLATVEALAKRGGQDPSAFEQIRNEAGRVKAIVDRLRDLARPVEPHLERAELNGLLPRIFRLLPRGPAIRFQPGDDAGAAMLDPDLFREAFENLVANAAEAGASTVTVTTGRDGTDVVVAVRNDGPPIPPEVLARLFEPFVTSKGTGLGLGLPFARKILRAQGGSLSGANVEGGVEFTVRLPWTS